MNGEKKVVTSQVRRLRVWPWLTSCLGWMYVIMFHCIRTTHKHQCKPKPLSGQEREERLRQGSRALASCWLPIAEVLYAFWWHYGSNQRRVWWHYGQLSKYTGGVHLVYFQAQRGGVKLLGMWKAVRPEGTRVKSLVWEGESSSLPESKQVGSGDQWTEHDGDFCWVFLGHKWRGS